MRYNLKQDQIIQDSGSLQESIIRDIQEELSTEVQSKVVGRARCLLCRTTLVEKKCKTCGIEY